MKKILSTLLLVAMLVSMFVIAAFPAAAADGIFTVAGEAQQYAEDFEGKALSVPGYEYTTDGFKMTTANWENTKAYSHLYTKDGVHLKQGVYMEIRVDEFDYDAKDKWFNVNIWSQPMFCPPSTNPEFGHGVQTVMRSAKTENGDGTYAGKISRIEWYTKEFKSAGNSTPVQNPEEEGYYEDIRDGKTVITLVVTYVGDSYACTINGVKAPSGVVKYLNETFGQNDLAYVGFAMQNSAGSNQSATVTKFGKTAGDAQKPQGTDKKNPVNQNYEYGEMQKADTVPAGEPAILMTGNLAESHLLALPGTGLGSKIEITPDFKVKVTGTADTVDMGIWEVDYGESYNLRDFPVALVVTKNLCTCEIGECEAWESASCYMMFGDIVAPAIQYSYRYTGMSEEACLIGEDSYLYFYVDMTELLPEGDEPLRINGTRWDISQFDLENPTYEVCFQAFFRNEDEALDYVNNYYKSLGYTDEDGDDEETTTAATTTAATTTAEETTATESSATESSAAESSAAGSSDDVNIKVGCSSVVGFGAIATVAVAAIAGIVAFKKKED